MITAASIFTPKSSSPEDLKVHARHVAECVQSLTRDERILLVSEIRNTIAPVALYVSMKSEERDHALLSDVNDSLSRLLALMTALSEEKS